MGVVLVQDAVIKNQASVIVILDDVFDAIPQLLGGNVVVLQIAVDGIVREVRMMVCKIRLRVIDLTGQNELTVITTSWLHRVPRA